MRLTSYACNWESVPSGTLWYSPVRTPPHELKWYPTPTATSAKRTVDGEEHGTTRAAASADLTESDGEWTMVDL